MNWFRRDKEDFNVDWELLDGHYKPKVPQPFPTPWRLHPKAEECLLLPRSVCFYFADQQKMRNIERLEPEKVSELRESISKEGLKVPLKMTWDAHGKIRYHDGYHRMTAMRVLDEPQHVPVLLSRSDRVKGYGRQPEHYIELLFSALNEAIQKP